MRDAVENFLNTAAARILPAAVLVIAGLAFFWHLRQPVQDRGIPLALTVWEQTSSIARDLPFIAERLSEQPSRASVETRLSTHPFWLATKAKAPPEGGNWAVEFPSRHAMDLQCWDRHDGRLLGQVDRDSDNGGALKATRGGFALNVAAGTEVVDLICRSTFRGPAKLTAQVWGAAALNAAEDQFQRIGSMIEVGLGVLAMSMALIATINRSRLYWAFVGWLFVSMRMALLSDGSDFLLFGMPLPAALLTPMRQWTVCTYFVLTVTVFGLLFRQEMIDIGARWLLRLQQVSCVLMLLLCATLSFEQVLPVLWIGSALLFAITLPQIYRTLRRPHSRPALWYASSIVVALVATLNEVVAAAIGQQALMRGLNSVTAAIATALLASAAVAEHMRTDRRQREQAQRTMKAAYDDSPIGLFTVRDGETIVNANPAFKTMLGLSASSEALPLACVFGDEVVGEFLMLNAMAAPAALDLQARPLNGGANGRDEGGERWFAIKASTIDGRIFEGSLQDITERVRATSRLEFLVNHDPLTECLNLRGLSRKFERAQQPPKTLAYFDLDRFKLINDLYGHGAGDAVLKQVCERIRSQLGAADLLARVGGDEFVVAFPHASIAEASQRCQNICALIASAPFQIDTQRFALSISGGLVATDGFGDAELKEIVSAADTLCRMAKKRPSERLVVMDGGDAFFKHHKNELELIGCLERGETPEGLFLMMQPELSLNAPLDSLNFEVLLRMRKPSGELVPAQIIIEAAEAHAKTAIIDHWVVSTTIAWLEAHASQLRKTQFVGVNLSGSSLNDEAFVEDLFRLFEYHRDAVSRLCIEITETVALTDMVHMQRFIDRARDLGVKVALDDFGAGYSSFGYLKGLSVDALKLDGSLVRDAASNPASMAILAALGGLVRSLGMKSIGEYAENLPVLKALVAAGVDYAQGYAISRPVMPERILEADSAADFITDPEIAAFVRKLQARDPHTIPLFSERADAALTGMLH
ncbi:putative bifunctional diguanylate cyclase/phosphodiesterase [Roseateles violae]|uniref:EAL domain-containing protein n=1 Tax=Roseateles violae TaxID=3058042 RepID=A0ABT8DVS4_9BURK|nr:bifunctional diguanylate cyclase/phosphodiesterase [Pelomonas sp. PFR6]MDN3922253.1 EAL domain-containing protein [Pelomonas sp. PFR6]